MQDETSAIAAKSAGAGATALAAAFGLTWVAIAAAIVGSLCALHWEEPEKGSRIWRLVLQILAQGFLSALLASALPEVPGFAWTETIPVAVRAGLLALFANPAAKWIRAIIARRTVQGGGQ